MLGPGPGYAAWAAVLAAGGPPHGRLVDRRPLALDAIRFRVLWPDAEPRPGATADTAERRSTTSRSCCSARLAGRRSCSPATSRRASTRSCSRAGCRRSTCSRSPITGRGTATTRDVPRGGPAEGGRRLGGSGQSLRPPGAGDDRAARATSRAGRIEPTPTGRSRSPSRAATPRPDERPTARGRARCRPNAAGGAGAPAPCGRRSVPVRDPARGSVASRPARGRPAADRPGGAARRSSSARSAEPGAHASAPATRPPAGPETGRDRPRYHRPDGDLPGIGDRAAAAGPLPSPTSGATTRTASRPPSMPSEPTRPLPRRPAGALATRDRSRRARPPPR